MAESHPLSARHERIVRDLLERLPRVGTLLIIEIPLDTALMPSAYLSPAPHAMSPEQHHQYQAAMHAAVDAVRAASCPMVAGGSDHP